jgi:hypothetical protein
MKKAAVGFRVHSGWAAMVVVSLEKGLPVLLSRKRLQLVEVFSYKFRQPYHTAERMRREDSGKFISDVRSEAEELACYGLNAAQAELQARGYRMDRAALLLASGRTLPELEKILQSHALIHTADGELFRQALRDASGRCALRLTGMKERELLEGFSKALSTTAARLLKRATALGKPFGAPWSQDEKFAMLAAWRLLQRSRGPDGLEK